jgi:hypothetical protein
MRSGWDTDTILPGKIRNGVKDPSKVFGIDKEMRDYRVTFNAQQLYHYTKYKANYTELPNQGWT